MRLLRRRREHHVTVLQIAEDGPGAFVPMCSCGEASPQETREEAFRWARSHGTSVSEEVEDYVAGEGGEGWLCLFCGETIGRAPLRVFVHWTDDGVDGEQWFGAHRACFVQHMSDDEVFEPQFSIDVGERNSQE
jgi:hypothetical protein